MKQATDDLIKLLKEAPNIEGCDLYELKLANGRQFFWTDTDKDVVVGDRLYSHDSVIAQRDQVQIHSSVMVDTLNVTLYVGENDVIETQTVIQAAHEGRLDRSILTLTRCFFQGERVAGTIQLFTGNVEVQEAGGLAIKLTVKAKTQGLNMGFPVRHYYPQGTYQETNNTVVADAQSNSACLIAPHIPRREVLL